MKVGLRPSESAREYTQLSIWWGYGRSQGLRDPARGNQYFSFLSWTLSAVVFHGRCLPLGDSCATLMLMNICATWPAQTQQRTESMPEERIYVLFVMFWGILEPRRQSNGRRREDTVHKQQRHIQAINRGKFRHIRAHSGTFGNFVHVKTRKKTTREWHIHCNRRLLV